MLKDNSRKPRAIVMVNGVRMAHYTIEVNSNGFYLADTFKVELPVHVHGQTPSIDRSWWGGQDVYDVEIYIGFPPNPDKYTISDLGDPLITGRADNNPDSIVKNTITLSGRDFTSLLIDDKTTMKWPEKTSSEIATMIAQEVGLTPVVTKTTRKAGLFYKHDHARMQIETSKWDLLTWLAAAEKFSVFVQGNKLHFEDTTSNPQIYPLQVKQDVNGILHVDCTDLVFERNMTLAKDITVYVKSWKLGADKKPYVKMARATHTRDKLLRKASHNLGKPQVIERTIPGLTPEQALQKAQQILMEVSRHQIRMDATGMPGDNTITPRHLVRVTGTDVYDQDYYPDSIIRRYDIDDGYSMDIVAKNHDAYSQVVL